MMMYNLKATWINFLFKEWQNFKVKYNSISKHNQGNDIIQQIRFKITDQVKRKQK